MIPKYIIIPKYIDNDTNINILIAHSSQILINCIGIPAFLCCKHIKVKNFKKIVRIYMLEICPKIRDIIKLCIINTYIPK